LTVSLGASSKVRGTKSLTGDVAIVGGSLAGLATGIGLARRGVLVNVFEQNSGGDAAHVASPMVDAGFSSGLQDGKALSTAVSRSGGTAAYAGNQALRRYDEVRLVPNRRRVLESLAKAQDLLTSTAAQSN
jgi:2-polyprenyl-6-methoxyphenol hydroxylase-like FAD-dependent oxidoreductase